MPSYIQLGGIFNNALIKTPPISNRGVVCPCEFWSKLMACNDQSGYLGVSKILEEKCECSQDICLPFVKIFKMHIEIFFLQIRNE